MTKLDERVSLEMEMDLMALFSEDAACEVDGHDEDVHMHEGAGEWYLVGGPCVHCGGDEEVVLICDKFKNLLDSVIETGVVPCSDCHRYRKLKEVIVRYEKRIA